MASKALHHAGYVVVGVGVLVLQELYVRRRDIGRHAGAVLTEVKTRAAPVTSRLDSLPGLPGLPGPVGRLVDGGRALVSAALRPDGSGPS